jgi:hypothetical protein
MCVSLPSSTLNVPSRLLEGLLAGATNVDIAAAEFLARVFSGDNIAQKEYKIRGTNDFVEYAKPKFGPGRNSLEIFVSDNRGLNLPTLDIKGGRMYLDW